MPEPKIDFVPPIAVGRAPLPKGGKAFWTLRAVYPVPYGSVWIRYWEMDNNEYLDVLTASGMLLQRARLDPSPGTDAPASCEALYLLPTRKRGLLLYLRTETWHLLYAFPDGFSGFFSENSVAIESSKAVRFVPDSRGIVGLQLGKERRYWSGISFAEGKPGPHISEGTAPNRLPVSPTQEKTRFAAVFFDRLYYLRWVTRGQKATLEVLDKSGRRLAHHALRDTFGASPRWTFLNAVWADDKHKRQPVVVVRDDDQVRVHVFTDGLRTLLVSQDFNDSSTSISATTVSFGRDKHGLLTVTESSSERGGEDGSPGNSSESSYQWDGKAFQ